MSSTGNEMKPKQGEVYLADIYFRDLNIYKLRPVVIVAQDKAVDIDVVTAPITGTKARNEYDVPIIHWQQAGLVKESVARTTKLLTLESSKLRKKLGELHVEDLEKILEKCKEVF